MAFRFLRAQVVDMLFWLSDRLVSALKDPSERENVLRGVKNILRGMYESNHLVHASRSTILTLIDEIDDPDCESVLTYINGNYAMLNYGKIKTYVQVVEGRKVLNQICDRSTTVINVSIDFFQTSCLLKKTRVLIEHTDEDVLYRLIADYHRKLNFLGNVTVSFEGYHGGGTTIGRVFEKHCESQDCLCLALCDTDQKYPEAPIGSTCQKIQEVNLQNKNPLCSFRKLEVHEIENLIPINYILKMKKISHASKTFLINARTSPHRDLLAYFDFKNGITAKHVRTNDDYRHFARVLLVYCNSNICLEVLDTMDDKDVIIPSVGKILKKLKGNLDSIKDEEPDLLEFQKKEWDRIGCEILAWACARNKETLNV